MITIFPFLATADLTLTTFLLEDVTLTASVVAFLLFLALTVTLIFFVLFFLITTVDFFAVTFFAGFLTTTLRTAFLEPDLRVTFVDVPALAVRGTETLTFFLPFMAIFLLADDTVTFFAASAVATFLTV